MKESIGKIEHSYEENHHSVGRLRFRRLTKPDDAGNIHKLSAEKSTKIVELGD